MVAGVVVAVVIGAYIGADGTVARPGYNDPQHPLAQPWPSVTGGDLIRNEDTALSGAM
jgi:hypothetical protein